MEFRAYTISKSRYGVREDYKIKAEKNQKCATIMLIFKTNLPKYKLLI